MARRAVGNFKFKVGWWALVALGVGGGVGLRLRALGYTEIFGDQALTLNMALEWLHGGALPLASMKSSFGVFNPPLVEYLYAAALWVQPSLSAVVLWVALLNLAGVLVSGWVVARVLNWRVGLAATLLFLVNPWAVFFGRFIWMQSFVPAFAALLFACVFQYFLGGQRARWLVAAGAGLAATIQTHLSAVLLLPVLALIGLRLWAQLNWKGVAGGAAVFALSFAPFLVFQWRTNFVDWAALQAGFGQPATTSAAALLLLLDLVQTKGIYATAGVASLQWQALDPAGGVADLVSAGLLLGAVSGAGLALAARGRAIFSGAPLPRLTVALGICLLWLGLPVLALLRHTHYLQNYYLLFVLPAPFVLVALCVDETAQWFQRQVAGRGGPRLGLAAGLLAWAPVALVVAQQAYTNVVGQNLLARGVVGRQRIVDVDLAIARTQALLAARPGCPLVVLSEGAEYESSSFALLREFVAPTPVRFAQANHSFLLPTPCALYFLTQPEALTLAPLAQLTPLPAATITTPEQTWRFYDLPVGPRQTLAAQWAEGAAPLGTWANGLQLLQFTAPLTVTAGQTFDLQLTWQATQAGDPAPLHFGLYLLQGEATLITQADGPGVETPALQAGDLFQLTAPLTLPPDLPPGPYQLATALYTYPVIQRIPLTTTGDLLFFGTVQVVAP